MSHEPHQFTISPLTAQGWHPIPGHDLYRINQAGEVLSLRRRVPKILKSSPSSSGCPQVDLDGERYSIAALLRLVFDPRIAAFVAAGTPHH